MGPYFPAAFTFVTALVCAVAMTVGTRIKNRRSPE